MANTIGLKIGIDGENEYKKAINNIVQVSKTLDAEMKAVTSGFTKQTSEEEKATKTKEVLTKQIENERKMLEKQNEMLNKAIDLHGEDSNVVNSWREAIYKTTTRINNLEGELDGLNGTVKETNTGLKDGTTNTSMFGDMLKSRLVSEAIIGGLKTMATLVANIAKDMADAVTDTLAWADDLNTLSIQTGISTDKLQELQYMSSLLDVDVTTIQGSLKKLTKAMGSAASGSGSTYEAFKKLGVSVTDSNGELLDSYEVFLNAIDALGQMSNETERDVAAMEIFGKSAMDLNTLIEAGSGEMQKLAEEAQAVGYVMGDADISKLTEAQDTLDRIKNQLTAVKNEAVLSFFPSIQDGLETALGLIRGDLSVESLIENFKEGLPELEENVATLVTDIGTWLIDNADDLIEAGIELGKALLKGILKGLDNLAAEIGKKATQAYQGSIDEAVGGAYGGGTSVNGGGTNVFNVYGASGQSPYAIAQDINGILGGLY